MASTIAVNRLRKELSKLKKDPPPGIIAEPKESDILTWFYALQGPPDSPYEGGVYVGKLRFPSEYPMKPPSIMMMTPSARFQVNTRLCMSMSDFHPESWNPMWSVATILQGVVSFMTSEELTTGGLKAPDSERKRLAGLSKAYNDKFFKDLFDGDMDAAFQEAEEARQSAEQAQAQGANGESSTVGRGGRSRRVAGPRRREKQSAKSEDKAEDEEQSDNHQEQQEQEQEEAEESAPKELSAAEIEKRRKKNAKKRAKQKAKKSGAKVEDGSDDANKEEEEAEAA
ncbi:enzyme E2 6 [Seminavis robusta]|uniref:Enzyme E2 6 n=1 Tax=Seminavis robusta TaxID=568900 RepID=A0A9N8E4B1_9STRA|nr:enzyme E2 6 [Seminavis robusta]|eukprot:Sro642_g180210.1 enzyme E2 6 (284) ;mRNA; r:39481-40332